MERRMIDSNVRYFEQHFFLAQFNWRIIIYSDSIEELLFFQATYTALIVEWKGRKKNEAVHNFCLEERYNKALNSSDM